MVDMVTDTNASVKRAYMGIMENNALIVVGKEVHPMHRVPMRLAATLVQAVLGAETSLCWHDVGTGAPLLEQCGDFR